MEFYTILLMNVVMFSIILAAMTYTNHQVLKSSDKRLESAHDMVKKLAHSADQLAASMSELKDLHIQTKKDFDKELAEKDNMITKWESSYTKLLHKYESLEERIINNYEKMKDESFHALKEMAKKPTIHNSNVAEKV